MVAFPETEPMTIKRIEVALRNKDLYLLQEATNKLHEKGHEIYIITARYFEEQDIKKHGEIKQIVEKWLQNYNIHYEIEAFHVVPPGSMCDILIRTEPY